jgi:hypothetical protein
LYLQRGHVPGVEIVIEEEVEEETVVRNALVVVNETLTTNIRGKSQGVENMAIGRQWKKGR